MFGMEFAHPSFLYLLLLIPALVAWYWWRSLDPKVGLRYSSFQLLGGRARWWTAWYRHLPFALRMLGIACLVVALARPQEFSHERNTTTEGIDIMFALDVSGSMLARDFTPDRIEAAKALGIQFVSGRASDRMGLVIFAGEAFTMCPLTVDQATLINQFHSVSSGMLEDGTAIGSGLAMSVKRLLSSEAISRVVILLTDGVNNAGEISPSTAAEIARTYGIRVYVIGIGTEGMAPYPVQTPYGVQFRQMEVHLDEDLLRELAQSTGGEYFRATGNQALEEVYQQIDRLERSKIHVDELTHFEEGFMWWLLLALGLFAFDIILREVVLRILP